MEIDIRQAKALHEALGRYIEGCVQIGPLMPKARAARAALEAYTREMGESQAPDPVRAALEKTTQQREAELHGAQRAAGEAGEAVRVLLSALASAAGAPAPVVVEAPLPAPEAKQEAPAKPAAKAKQATPAPAAPPPPPAPAAETPPRFEELFEGAGPNGGDPAAQEVADLPGELAEGDGEWVPEDEAVSFDDLFTEGEDGDQGHPTMVIPLPAQPPAAAGVPQDEESEGDLWASLVGDPLGGSSSPF